MLKFLGSVARVAFGFILASIAAGFVTMLFVNTPSEVLNQPMSRLPRTAGETFELALLTATHVAIFACIFALIVGGLGEIFSLRRLPFYLIGGVAIASLGFLAQYASEVQGEPTIFNNYALKAFLTTGFVAGFVYWLAAGQFAGRAPVETAHPPSSADVADQPPSDALTVDPAPVRQSPSLVTPRPTYRTLLKRLSFRADETANHDAEGGTKGPASSEKR
ncbi:hypothetical protein Hden_3343 [Hyphomicrobium denitrificans ATCC 51888]|uniref:Uncharacterized protein n=1 Tax=Hyphomicrobium denitrificans (strain ATCC 51888 / DSM 1869 / NCIMB 11706 / TK 0415) TaxID=582899 RepID=D8JXF5_HYPDA|nr:hypothetical protein [Hyphomicrobium denitrificans]ADJ25136.1 hypothetical protein Hden_3343 [Hyphomicrobium denitrificans ATCC 51888]